MSDETKCPREDGTCAHCLRAEVTRLRAEAEGWKTCAADMSRGMEFYRGLVTRVGEGFGVEARTSDDGSVQDSVLALKVPELVDNLRAELETTRDAEASLTARLARVVRAVGEPGPCWRCGRSCDGTVTRRECTRCWDMSAAPDVTFAPPVPPGTECVRCGRDANCIDGDGVPTCIPQCAPDVPEDAAVASRRPAPGEQGHHAALDMSADVPEDVREMLGQHGHVELRWFVPGMLTVTWEREGADDPCTESHSTLTAVWDAIRAHERGR